MRIFFDSHEIRALKTAWHYVNKWCLCLVMGMTLPAADQSSGDFTTAVQPILKQHCFGCHGPDKQKGKLRLDTINADMINGIDGETWHDVLHQLQRGEMPPEDKPQLSTTERTTIINWLQASFKKAAEHRKPAGQQTLRRLTREEYANTMRDFIGIDLDYAAFLPPEPMSPDGFTNNGASLGFSPMHLEYLLDSARMAMSKAIVEGPEPKIYQQKSTKNEPVNNNKKPKKGAAPLPDAKLIFSGSSFQTKISEFPREGDVTISAKIKVTIPDGAASVRIQTWLGHRADTQYPSAIIGETDITTSGTHELTWTGRIERFPLPGLNPKFPGLLIHIAHLETNGSPFSIKPAKKKSSHVFDPQKDTHIIIEEVAFVAPHLTMWPPPHHRQIFFERPSGMSDDAYAHAVITRFTERAYRRSVNDQDLAPIIGYYHDILQQTNSPITAMREALAMVLVSPDFLYLLQPQGEKTNPRSLTQDEIASRLSYFLWGTMPDAALATAARKNNLTNAESIASQTRRLLQDNKSAFFITHFVDQWLDLSGLERIAVNPEYYPDFEDTLKPYMREETRQLFADMIRQNTNALTLLNANYTFVNKPLADHYGITGPSGLQFERVPLLPQHKRGGLLAHASIHLIGSTGEDSHPIRRAVWVRDRLLNDPPAPPPPDVPALDEENPNFNKLSLKEQLELHRKKESCNDCHKSLDPWGVPFEHYDATGQWRDQVKRIIPKQKQPTFAKIDDSAVLPGNKPVTGIDGLRNHLLTHERDRFAEAIVHRLTTYAIGRTLTFNDQPAIAILTKHFAANDYRLADLVVAITTSPLFLQQ